MTDWKMYPENFEKMIKFQALIAEVTPPGCILMAYRGSHAHGLHVPSDDPNSVDDVDLIGVYVESMDFYMGLDHKALGYGGSKSDTIEKWINEYDTVSYELRKLFGLLLKGNPNVLTLLFLHPRHIIFQDPEWEKVVENRDMFVSQKAFYSFGGYANEQLRKMTSGTHQGYMGEKRKSLVEKYGYDTKNAAHLIRLLRMGVEYLKHGHLTIDRTNVDREELLSIKRGEWLLEDVKKEAERWEKELQRAKEYSKLPEKADFQKVNALCTNLIKSYHERIRSAG